MLIDLSKKGYLIVRKEITDPKFGKSAKGESWFFYRLCKALKAQGYDCIKNLAWKDGHLVDNFQYYIRDRKDRWMVWDESHNIRMAGAVFDEAGEITLRIRADLIPGGICK